MKRNLLLIVIALASCNTPATEKKEPVKELPLEEQLSKVDDSVRDITMKIIADSTVVNDTVLKKQVEQLSNRRDELKRRIAAAENDSLLKK